MSGLAFYLITTPYPDFTQEMLQRPAVELIDAWDANPIWSAIYLSDDMQLLRKVWSVKPTMVHPTHVEGLGAEVALLTSRADGLTTSVIVELRAVEDLCTRTAEAGNWLVTVGP